MVNEYVPLKFAKKWSKLTPSVYSFLDIQNFSGSGELGWPKRCVLPIALAATYLKEHGVPSKDAERVSYEITPSWAWLDKRLILTFDDDFAEFLTHQVQRLEIDDLIPEDRLFCLPALCVYIQASIVPGLDGFFVWIDYDKKRNNFVLQTQWLMDDGWRSYNQCLHFKKGWTWKECIQNTIRDTQQRKNLDITYQEIEPDDLRVVLFAVQLILYILSENVDADPVCASTWVVNRVKNVVNVKKKQEEPLVNEIRIGERIGRELRRIYKKYLPRESFTEYGQWKQEQFLTKHGKERTRLTWIAPDVIGKFRHESGALVFEFPEVEPREE